MQTKKSTDIVKFTCYVGVFLLILRVVERSEQNDPSEIDKLACQAESAGIFAVGEPPRSKIQERLPSGPPKQPNPNCLFGFVFYFDYPY